MTTPSLPNPEPRPGMHFDDAANAVLDHLRTIVPMGSWAVTRHDGDQQLCLQVRDVESDRQSDSIHEHAPLLALLSTLLTAILEADLANAEHARVLEHAQRTAELDPLTGLLNRCGWERFMEREEERLHRFGDPSAVIVVELDRLEEINATRGNEAGDGYIGLAAAAIRNTVRGVDVVARLGGDEFGVIVTGITPDACELLVDRILDAFRSDGVAGSIGWAPYTMASGFLGAIAAAAAAMNEDKQQRSIRPGRLTLVR